MSSETNTVEPRAVRPAAGKYLTILLEGECYGIPVLSVREIIRLPKITPVPQAPPYVSGVINLRGRVIAVVDLRLRFGLQPTNGDRACIVVVRVSAERGSMDLGLVVDAVEEVLQIGANDVEPTPEFGVKVDTQNLIGIAKTKGRVAMLLDIDRVVTGESLREMASAAAD